MSISIIVGGQYGSEGKGKVTDFWAKRMNARAIVRVGGPNSGHSIFTEDGKRIAFTQLPVSCMRKDILSILPSGTYIDLQRLCDEIERVGVTPSNLFIDPNAVIITPNCKQMEQDLLLSEFIGSTLSGTGNAVANRVMRTNVTLASDILQLAPFVTDTKTLMRSLLDHEEHIVIEGTQGYGLSNLHAKCYPYATGRDTTAAGFLSETGLSPFDVEHIVMVLRAFPIRVGGNSGPLANEITWDLLTEESGSPQKLCEHTTVTNKVRRVGRFDPGVVRDAITANQPDVIVLNHVDYFDMRQHGKIVLSEIQENKIIDISSNIGRPIDYVGNGPNTMIKFS